MSDTTIFLTRDIPSLGDRIEVKESVNEVRSKLNRAFSENGDKLFHALSFTMANGDKRVILTPDLVGPVTGDIKRRADGSEVEADEPTTDADAATTAEPKGKKKKTPAKA